MTVYRLWPSTSGPGAATADADNYSLGVEFQVTSNCNFTGWYFWANTAATATFSLYQVINSSSGTLLNQVSSVSIAAPLGEWKYIPVVLPTSLTTGVRYKAVIHSTTNNFYSSTSLYWSTGPGSAGLTNGILSAYNSANASPGQGSFAVGSTPAYPTTAFNHTNYWIDLEVDDDTGAAPEGELNFTQSRPVTINGLRSPVGSLAAQVTRAFTCEGKRSPVGTLNFAVNRNFSITGGAVKVGDVNMNVSRQITITGQHPSEPMPPAPGNTRSDIEYNYQQFITVGELEPLTMLDYFKINEPNQGKMDRPQELP